MGAGEVSKMAGVEVGKEVFEALELNRYCVTAAVDFLLTDISGRARGGIWSAEGTGSRILGREGGRSPGRSAQEKLAGIKSKLASEEKKRATKETKDDAELVITNIQTLTI